MYVIRSNYSVVCTPYFAPARSSHGTSEAGNNLIPAARVCLPSLVATEGRENFALEGQEGLPIK